MTEFWKDFLPNFAATICGVILGALAALLTNKIIVGLAEKAKRKEEVARLHRSLTAIKEALRFNIGEFALMLQYHMDNKAITYFRVDDSTWDVVNNDVVQYLHNPALQQRIAYHFSLIKELRKAEALYLDSSLGVIAVIAASQHGEALLKDGLSTDLPKIINELINEAGNLIKVIDSVQAKI